MHRAEGSSVTRSDGSSRTECAADIATYHRLDTRFHEIIAESGGNPLLAAAATQAREEMFIHGNALWLFSGWDLVYPTGPVDWIFREEHQEIARAVLAGDRAAAERAMTSHLYEAEGQFERLLVGLAAS